MCKSTSLRAVEQVFGDDVDYGMLVKIYGADKSQARRFTAPPNVLACGAERQNLTMRMLMRRFTRPTNAFSKKVESHGRAMALHAMYYRSKSRPR